MSTDISDLSIVELKRRKENIGSDDHGRSAEHIDEELERRADERARTSNLLDLKLQLALAEERGLGDDPTVEKLREQVAELEEALHPPSPQAELASFTGVDEDAVARLSDEEAEQAREHVEAIEMLATSSNTAARTSVQEHREDLEALLENRDVEAAALSEAAVPDDEPGASIDDLLEEA